VLANTETTDEDDKQQPLIEIRDADNVAVGPGCAVPQ
jgi:hypothetical protein